MFCPECEGDHSELVYSSYFDEMVCLDCHEYGEGVLRLVQDEQDQLIQEKEMDSYEDPLGW